VGKRGRESLIYGSGDGWYFAGHAKAANGCNGGLVYHVLEGGTDLCPLRSWRDTDKRPLEDRLSGVIPVLLMRVDAKKAERAKVEAEARERAVLERRKREAEQQRQREKARVEGLVREAESWHKSQSIREYLRAVRQTVVAVLAG